MAFWSSHTLETKCPQLIDPFRIDRIKHSAYELSVGGTAYISSDGKKSKVESDSPLTIPPGQFGLVITREVISVPKNAIAFISIRAGIKFRGLVNVSGFHVDPGYNDRLMFAVYNAGSQPVVLDYDQPVFMIWYADLDNEDEKPYKERTGEPRGISADDIMKIQGEVASPAELKKTLDELRNELDKKFHQIDLARQFNRWLVGMLITFVLGIIGWLVIRPMLDGSSSKKESGVPSQSEAANPSKGDKADTKEKGLGVPDAKGAPPK